jgi:class 3 adenylate cyclase
VLLVDEARYWLKSRVGGPEILAEAPRECSVCNTTILQSEPVVVSDLQKDERFHELPYVIGEPYYRFYCGVPLVSPRGYALGTICVMDTKPREPPPEMVEAMVMLSHQVMAQLELRRNLTELSKAKSEVEAEKAKSDRLLLNILPEPVAEELKRINRVEAVHYHSVTIMFADVKGFTRITNKMHPKDLVGTLNEYFSLFDDIIVSHKVEKLKTIGDAYMCAGGLPEANRTHPLDVCLAALEIQTLTRQHQRDRQGENLPGWEFRIGVHTGPVMAGVIGKNKFAYDVWGRTANLASRLEAAGEAFRVCVSRQTCERVKDYFEFVERGRLAVKNMDPVEMFYITRLRPEFAQDEDGRIPNAEFQRRYESL